MKIGNALLPHGLMLAPMAGVSDRSMRKICERFGAEYAVTEMISAKALVYEQLGRPSAPAKTADLAAIGEDEPLPVALQLFGSEPEFLAEAARIASRGEYRGFRGKLPCAIDINMGCPVRKVVSNGEGCSLMRDPEKIHLIVSAVSSASALPVTVKLRAGWDEDSVNAPECAAAAEAGGASAVVVHARTREQFYRPGIDPSVIRRTVEKVGIPVVGNGDVASAKDALALFRDTGCAGIAVGRGAIGNPWIFREIAAALDGESIPAPTNAERLDAALGQLEWSVGKKAPAGERRKSSFLSPAISRGFAAPPRRGTTL
ncbi:MAG: tRNA-dihydrouridine synthase family protein [Clostridia bacterium]|nr:tRNA-dihydrouridine synthase family protein [Clostridia bacterium]